MFIFAAVILVAGSSFIFISKSLFKGNTNLVHGKGFEVSKDKVAYTKKLGTPLLICGILWIIASIICLLNSGDLYFYISYAIFMLAAIYLIIHLVIIDRKEIQNSKDDK